MKENAKDRRKTRIFQGTSVQARDRRASVMVGALEGNQLQRMLEIEARANPASAGNRGSGRRPLPGAPSSPAPSLAAAPSPASKAGIPSPRAVSPVPGILLSLVFNRTRC